MKIKESFKFILETIIIRDNRLRKDVNNPRTTFLGGVEKGRHIRILRLQRINLSRHIRHRRVKHRLHNSTWHYDGLFSDLGSCRGQLALQSHKHRLKLIELGENVTAVEEEVAAAGSGEGEMGLVDGADEWKI